MNTVSKAAILGVTLLAAVPTIAQRPFYLLPGVHPGYSLVSMRPASMESTGNTAAPNVGGMTWLADGRLFIASMSASTSGNPSLDNSRRGISHGYILTGIPGATSNATVTAAQVSTGYQMPSGAVTVGDTIYVLDNEEGLTRLVPSGATWTKTTIHKGTLGRATTTVAPAVDTANRSWTGGLVYRDGFLYAVVGNALMPGGTAFGFTGSQEAKLHRGKGVIYKISRDGSVVDTMAAGVRNPVGLNLGPEGELFYTDNQGSFMPASAMFHVKQGAFFGHTKNPFDNGRRTTPTIIFPYGSSNTGGTAANPAVARVATGMLTMTSGRFRHQMLVGVNHTCGLNRVYLEKIPLGNGEYVFQGALFPFSQGFGVGTGPSSAAPIAGVLPDFRANVHRMSYGPDGQIYLGGGNSTGGGNGGHGFDGSIFYGLTRLVPNNDTVFEMKAIRSLSATQLEIEFTEPVVAAAASNFTVRQGVSVQSTGTGYGAGYASGTTTLTVTAVTLNAAKTKATLTITGLVQRAATAATVAGSADDRTWGSLVQINVTGVAAVSGRSMWGDGSGGGVAWYTLNKFGPGEEVGGPSSLAPRVATSGREGLIVKSLQHGILVRSPVAGAYVLSVLDTRGRVLARHAVAAGRQEFLVPSASLGAGLSVLEARAADGSRFVATVAGL